MIIGNAIYLGGTPLPDLNNPAAAGDIRYGKQAVDGDGELLTGSIPDYAGQTSTGSVIPVDTGANGLYKSMLEGSLAGNLSLYDSGLTRLRAGALGSLSATGATIFFEFENVTAIIGGLVGNSVARVKFNKTVSLGEDSFRNGGPVVADFAGVVIRKQRILYASSTKIFVIRSNTLCPAEQSNFAASHNASLAFYVPPLLVSDYKSATNWVTYANIIYPFYLAQTVEDINVLLADSDIPGGSLIICDVATPSQKYTVKPVTTE